MENNPISNERLAELDRLVVSASRGGLASLVDQETYRSELARAYPALRKRLTDAEAQLADAERERDAAEAIVAGLRGALDIARVKFDWIRQNAEPPAIDGGIGSVWRAAISAHNEVVAALALTPASAGNRTDEETEAANAR